MQQAPYGIADAEVLDEWAYNNPDILLVFAAGNNELWSMTAGKSQFAAQVQAWATAKNILTVGATYTDRPIVETSVWDKVDYSEANLKTFKSKKGTVAPFSNRGPVAKTKRTKPDIVAPGVGILSARAANASAQAGIGDFIKFYGKVPGSDQSTPKLIFCSGTSMATPVASGCVALVREAFGQWQSPLSPSASLIKALLINGADDLGE